MSSADDVPTEKEFMCSRCADWAVVLRPESSKSAIHEPLCKKHADLTTSTKKG